MKNIIVATKPNIGYYNILKQSCKKNNIDLITLGLGMKWDNFTLKFKLWKEYIFQLDDTEIVMINDAYDVIILQDSNIILKKFKKFNKKIVFGIQSGFFNDLLFAQPVKCTENIICTGNIIGYVKYLKKFINKIYKYKKIWKELKYDDQEIVNNICSKEQSFFKKYTVIDKERNIFFTTTGDDYYFIPYLFNRSIKNLYMKNGKILNKRNIEPSVLHLGGNIDGNKYLTYIGYNTTNLKLHGGYKILQVGNFAFILIRKYFHILFIIIFIIYKIKSNYYKTKYLK